MEVVWYKSFGEDTSGSSHSAVSIFCLAVMEVSIKLCLHNRPIRDSD